MPRRGPAPGEGGPTRSSVPADPAASARLLAVAARAQARLGRTAAAVRSAREAQHLAARGDASVQITAELALAESLAAVGDAEGARAAVTRALRLSRALHLPLARIRAVLVASTCGDRRGSARALARLKTLMLANATTTFWDATPRGLWKPALRPRSGTIPTSRASR